MKPTVRTPRKIIMEIKPNHPRFPNVMAQGNKNATSRSKMMKRMATR